jgi:hypothetical protein
MAPSPREATLRNGYGSLISLNRVVAILLVLGVGLRLRAYLANRSLWLDESFLALNIVNRSFDELWRPLDYGQAAPLGFLFVERLAVDLLGTSEYALRLFPLLCGIGSVLIFWRLACRLLPPIGVVIGVAIFSMSDLLVYYSAEVKQYSGDVATALFLWWAFTRLERRLEQGRWDAVALAMLLGALAVFFSYPAVFVLGGVGLRWFWQAVQQRSRTLLLVCGVIGIAWLGTFAAVYLTFHSVNEAAMTVREEWRRAAAPLLPRSSDDFAWLKSGALILTSMPLGWTAAALATLSGLVGASELWRRHREWFWSFAGTLVLTWLASGIGKYPLATRLWLFLCPAIILLVAAGAAEVWRRTRPAFPILAPAFTALLLAQPALLAGERALRPREREEVRPLLRHVSQRQRPEDTLYLYPSAEPAARYYAGRGLAFAGHVIVGEEGRGSWRAYERELDKVRSRSRVWFLFAHVHSPNGINEESYLLQELDRLGVRLDAQRRPGAAVYLYDLAQPR